MNIRDIIQEQIAKTLITESKVQMEDRSTKGIKNITLVNTVWEKGLEGFDYNKAEGVFTDEGNLLDIYMNNGDKVTWVAKNNPAIASIFVNGEEVKSVNSKEKFSNKYWDLVKQNYASSSLDKNAGV